MPTMRTIPGTNVKTDIEKEAWEIVDDIMEVIMAVHPDWEPDDCASVAEAEALNLLMQG